MIQFFLKYTEKQQGYETYHEIFLYMVGGTLVNSDIKLLRTTEKIKIPFYGFLILLFYFNLKNYVKIY